MNIALALLKDYWKPLAGAAVLALASWLLWHKGVTHGERVERERWEARVEAQKQRAARAQTELEITNRNIARAADNAIDARMRRVLDETQKAVAVDTEWRRRLRSLSGVPSNGGTCEPAVSLATECVDYAAKARDAAVRGFDAAESNADQVDGLLQHIEQSCQVIARETKNGQVCPDYGATRRQQAREAAGLTAVPR